jgi:pilus assembly protein CpaB
MKSKTLILMVVAVACGLVASYLTSRMLAQQGQGAAADIETVKVLVARAKIPQGTKIKEPEKWFVEKEFAKGTEPKKAFTTFDQLKDKTLNKTIGSEVHVTPDDVLKKEDQDLSADLPKGTRAMAIRCSTDQSSGGFILPRSHVDIIAKTTGDQGPMAQILLQDMLVLAVDMKDMRDEGARAMQMGFVTLQVTPDQAEILTLASSYELRLVLRPQDDHEHITTSGVKNGDLARTARKAGSEKPEDPDAPPATASTVSPKIPAVPTAPAAPTTTPAVAEQPEPVVLPKHTLTVYNGENATKFVTVLDPKTGQPMTEAVEKSDAAKDKAAKPEQPKGEATTPPGK